MKIILKARGGASYAYDLPAKVEPVDTIWWNNKNFLRQGAYGTEPDEPTYLPIFDETWSWAIPVYGPQPTLIEPPPTVLDP